MEQNNIWINNYWSCNKCNSTNNSGHFCKCSETFRCPKCKFVGPINYSGINNDKVVCHSCKFEVNIIFDKPPNSWEIKQENNKKLINVKFIYLTRNIDISIDVTDFDIDVYNGVLPSISYKNKNVLCKRELDYIYVLLFGFYPGIPKKCYGTCFECYDIKVKRHKLLCDIFGELELNDEQHENILNIFSKVFLEYHLNLITLQNVIQSMTSNMSFSEEPKNTVSSDILKQIEEKSTTFFSINEKKDCNCSICIEKYKDYCKVYRMDCCKKIIHTDCIKKWFSEYNNTCPLCRHGYNT